MELVLIRHATTQGNLEKRFIGLTDIPILPEGEDLARQVGPTLPRVEHVYRSPLLRCRQTAALLWPEHLEQTVIEELRETDFGPFEGKNHEELQDDPLYLQWITTADFSRLPVGESAAACAQRAAAGIQRIVADAKAHGYSRVGAVTHGGTLMALLSALGRPERAYYEWSCTNCGGFLSAVEEEPLSLHVLSAVGTLAR